MTTTKSFSKKLVATMLAIATLFSVVLVYGNAAAVNATEDTKVQLYYLDHYFSKYGGKSFEAYVKTNDNAADQHVYVHFSYMDGLDWQDAEATYFKTLSDGSKLWKVYFSSFNTKFAIKYVADGVTYWDNNNGKDYTDADVIGAAEIVSERLGYQYYTLGGYRIDAVLQNLGYEKNVFVRYTTNNWQSYQDVALSYEETNENGTENWTVTINEDLNSIPTENFEYALCYRVNGKEYWANNFGENYNRNFYIFH